MSGPNDDLYDEIEIKRQLAPIFKSDSAVDHFAEAKQHVVYGGPRGHIANNIVIAIPGFLEWLRDYDSSPANAPIAAKINYYRSWAKTTARNVSGLLDTVFSSRTGSALLKEINSKDHTLTIDPTYGDDGDDSASRTNSNDDEHNERNGIGVDATVSIGELMHYPNGFSSKITFALAAGGPVDEILAHELFHAGALITGTEVVTPKTSKNIFMTLFYAVDDPSEFLAIQVENIYRQEKQRRGLRYNHMSDGFEIEGDHLLELYPGMVPTPEQMIRDFSILRPALFEALASIPAMLVRKNVMNEMRGRMRSKAGSNVQGQAARAQTAGKPVHKLWAGNRQ